MPAKKKQKNKKKTLVMHHKREIDLYQYLCTNEHCNMTDVYFFIFLSIEIHTE